MRESKSNEAVQAHNQKPFVRPAVNKMKQKAIEEMGRVLGAELKIYSL